MFARTSAITILIRLPAGMFLGTLMTAALGQNNLPVRWQAQYTQIYSEAATGTTLDKGLQLLNGATVVTDPALVLPGTASVRIKNYGTVTTSPAIVPLSGNTTYIVEFQYHVLNYGSSAPVAVYLVPVGDDRQQSLVIAGGMHKSALPTGTFSKGGRTASAAQYFFAIASSADSDVVVNSIKVLRQDSVQDTTLPASFAALEGRPFPRLGRYFQGDTSWPSRPGMMPYQYSVDQIESRLAFNDVIAGLWVDVQTSSDPGSIRRLRQLNPNAVILFYRISEEQPLWETPPLFSSVGLAYPFFLSLPDEWYMRDTAGNYSVEDQYPEIRFMNISPYSPVVGGHSFFSFLLGWLNGTMFPSGLWDGVFLDNLFAEANIHIPTLPNPAAFDFDYNRNGIRDETPASTSEMTRSAVSGMLQQFRAVHGDLKLVMGNSGSIPEPSLAPYVNGYGLECVSDIWSGSRKSMAGWRGVFDVYRMMQATCRRPRINILEGCGAEDRRADASYLLPTADDLRAHRLTLGTTLLSDGFYSFDLHDNFTVPLWYDEYSVDKQGNAVEDRANKGYLGMALTDAVELTDGGSTVLLESFDRTTLPPSFRANPAGAVSVSDGALIISQPDHKQNGSEYVSTNPAALPLDPGTYLVTFDWKVLETLDHWLTFNVTSGTQWLDSFRATSNVAGDSGTVHFPFILSAGDAGSVEIRISGGGKLAIDNFRVAKGGVGPWRRDFENGFVLVNPLSRPHTFSATELAGALKRTGIHRIQGTQAPDVNNGQPITGDLTVAPFDAIILLADRISPGVPTVANVFNAAGGQPGVVCGAFTSISGSNFTVLPYDNWNNSILHGRLPTSLDGVSVTMGGKPAFIQALVPGQVNVQAPDLDPGPVEVVVTAPGGISTAFLTNAVVHSPAFWPWPGNQPVATHADYSLAVRRGTFPTLTTVAAHPGEVLSLWGTGFGPANPPTPAGHQPAQAEPTQSPVSITLDGMEISVLAAVLTAETANYQIVIQIPPTTSDGDHEVIASVNGVRSPKNVFLTVQH